MYNLPPQQLESTFDAQPPQSRGPGSSSNQQQNQTPHLISSEASSCSDPEFNVVKNRRRTRKYHSLSSSSDNTIISKRHRKTPATQKKSLNSTRVPTANRFSPLNQDQPQDAELSEEIPRVKIPPIFVTKSGNVSDLIKALKAISPEFSFKDSKDFLNINCDTIDCYRDFCKLFDSRKLEYHSFRLPQDRTIDVVIKHMPTAFDDNEIAEELSALGYQDFKIMRVWDKEKKPIPVVAVYLNQKHTKNKDIYSLDRLLNCVVSVEPKKKSRHIPQCSNCQRYGHTKNYCKLAPRCMFCSASHLSANCDKMQDENVVKVCVQCTLQGEPLCKF